MASQNQYLNDLAARINLVDLSKSTANYEIAVLRDDAAVALENRMIISEEWRGIAKLLEEKRADFARGNPFFPVGTSKQHTS